MYSVKMRRLRAGDVLAGVGHDPRGAESGAEAVDFPGYDGVCSQRLIDLQVKLQPVDVLAEAKGLVGAGCRARQVRGGKAIACSDSNGYIYSGHEIELEVVQHLKEVECD